MDTCLGGLYRIVLVVNRRCGTGEIVDLIHFYLEREGDLMAHEFEVRILRKVTDVVLGNGKEVVHTEHVIAKLNEAIAKMRHEKTRAPGCQNPIQCPVPQGVSVIDQIPFRVRVS